MRLHLATTSVHHQCASCHPFPASGQRVPWLWRRSTPEALPEALLEALPETFNGGKHSGKSYGEVFADDPTHREWMLKISKANTESGRFAVWVRAKHPQFAAVVERSK